MLLEWIDKEAAMTHFLCRRALVALTATAMLAAAGCATEPTQQEAGTVVGGVLGGVIGSQVGSGRGRTTATIVGAIAGAAIGSAIGRTMDEADRARTAQVLETTPTGRYST
jgi:surface antigen